MTVSDKVWQNSRSRNGARLVLLALAYMADDSGQARLPVRRIAELTRLTPRAISKCLADLAALGEISYERGGGVDNPNSYSISLLGPGTSQAAGSGTTENGTLMQPVSEEGTKFPEDHSQSGNSEAESRNSESPKMEVSSSHAHGGNTPYGSITTTKSQQAPKPGPVPPKGEVDVPESARELVAALERSGMIVGWRLSEAEWARVTALVARWGVPTLVEIIARRWDANRPPQSARYLLRIWADLPSQAPSASAGKVVPLRRAAGWQPYRNPSQPAAYENGF
ncbi:hypothetical protein ACH4FX_33045 [Streptomyces sp. NPDC018019]|uniref:hypothetical protein n=1 Tax=Streptomyces sp. NPDC018019 TaxID=3365030 RepID=UPI0037BCE29B